MSNGGAELARVEPASGGAEGKTRVVDRPSVGHRSAPEALRILLVAADRIPPAPTGSGSRAIRWGLIDGLSRVGAVPAFYSAGPASRNAAEFAAARAGLRLDDGRFWYDEPGIDRWSDAVTALGAAMGTFRPNIILTYGIEPLRLARAAAPHIPTGIMSIDLEHLPVLYRHWYNLRYGRPKQKLKSFLQTPQQLLFARRVKRDIREVYPLADFVINHAAHHARWHMQVHGRPVLYTPNPIAPLPELPVRRPTVPPRFLLVGGIGGIATLTGLAWFAQKVYPLLEPLIAHGEFEAHLVGRGELEPCVDRRMSRLVRRGYVEDLTNEFAASTALLVPTPITLGFRTRIVDAFRHGVTVVAHAANGLGMAELAHERNALVTSTPEDFAAAVVGLARAPDEAERLGAAAFADFNAALSGVLVAKRLLEFAQPFLRAAERASAR